MSLFNIPVQKSNTDFSVTDYMILEKDKIVKVQFLSPSVQVFKHWLKTDGKWVPFNCLGLDACPVCARNAMLDGFEDQDFVARSERYVINVLDLTPVKRCPVCGYVNDHRASSCQNSECNSLLTEVTSEPLKKVRYLEGNKTLFIQLQNVEKTLLENGIDVKKVVFAIRMVDSKTFIVLPQIDDKDAVNPDDYRDQLFDLSKTGISLSYNELTTIMNGGSFKGVLSMRKDTKTNDIDSLFS